MQGQYGLSQRGDAPDFRASGIIGKNFADGRGNLTVAGEYNIVTGFTARDRDITARGNFFGSPPRSENAAFQRILYPQQRFTAFTAPGIPFSNDDFLVSRSGIRDANGQLLTFGSDGRLVPLDQGKVLRQGYISSGGNGFDLPAQNNILASSERYLGVAQGSFEFSPAVRVFGEAWYSRAKGINIIDQPNYNTALFDSAGTADGNIIVPLSNPFLAPADRAIIAANLPAGQTEFYLGKALADLTTGRAEATVESYRFVGGFDGTFAIGTREFNWEASDNYGRSKTVGRNFELVQQNFANALDAVAGPDGTITCRPGAAAAAIAVANPNCATLNPFGIGTASREARDYIFAEARPVSVNTQWVINANVQGKVLPIWGGDVQFSLGYEHREEKTTFDPGAYYRGADNGDGTRTQFGRSIPIDSVVGKFHTNEVVGELRIPLVSEATGLSWLRTAELDGAARYVNNSLSGGDLTWTAGGRLGFFRDLTFRGNFTRSIRSPAITEVFNPTSRAFDSGADPCDQNSVGNGPAPATRRANGIAAGINPDSFISDYSNFTVPVTIAGNPGLTNEKADSWTVGAIIQPGFLPGFNVAVDWININLKQAIVSLGGDDNLNACYDSADYPNSFCGLVDRGPDGQIGGIREGYYNAAERKFAGLTVAGSYRQRIGAGTVGLAVNYLYLDKLEQRVGLGDIDITRGQIGQPKHSGTANPTYNAGGFSALVQAQYFGKSRFDVNEAANARDPAGVSDWWLFNATLGYDVNRQFGMRFIVDNVFDRTPPYPVPAGGGTVTYYSGVLGRYFRIQATTRF